MGERCPKENLFYLLKELDWKFFKGAFSKEKVVLEWSHNMNQKWFQINKSNQKGKPAKIFLSRSKLENYSSDDFLAFVMEVLNKAYYKLGFDLNDADLFEETLLKCVKDLFSLQIDDDMVEYPVKFVMDDKIRKIEEKNIIDEELEILDPEPDIQILFKEYDKRFFGGILNQNKVEVYWSELLVVTAGVYDPSFRERPNQIRLSRKLLKNKERRHLVETLLHEMIHAYVDINDLDPPNKHHGDKFHEIARKLNQICGPNITVYHDLLEPPCQTPKQNEE